MPRDYTRTKLTWRMIYTDFKRKHPRLSKMASCFCPYDYAEILVYFNDGSKMTYNYDTCRVNFKPVLRENHRRYCREM